MFTELRFTLKHWKYNKLSTNLLAVADSLVHSAMLRYVVPDRVKYWVCDKFDASL